MKEIEIPEGYEARIEGNKVILERKESEDERIRRMIENTLREDAISEFISETSYREMIAYLERHKEPSSYSDLEITDVVRKALQECEGYKNCRCDVYAARVGAVVEGILQEQKPAEWSEEDEEHLDSIIESYKELLKDYSANNGVDYIPYNTPVVARTVLNDIKFLKSLHPQPHWKPSKEQMRVFLKATPINLMPEELPVYNSLYDDLQKVIVYEDKTSQ